MGEGSVRRVVGSRRREECIRHDRRSEQNATDLRSLSRLLLPSPLLRLLSPPLAHRSPALLDQRVFAIRICSPSIHKRGHSSVQLLAQGVRTASVHWHDFRLLSLIVLRILADVHRIVLRILNMSEQAIWEPTSLSTFEVPRSLAAASSSAASCSAAFAAAFAAFFAAFFAALRSSCSDKYSRNRIS